jgi:hypothetical protein
VNNRTTVQKNWQMGELHELRRLAESGVYAVGRGCGSSSNICSQLTTVILASRRYPSKRYGRRSGVGGRGRSGQQLPTLYCVCVSASDGGVSVFVCVCHPNSLISDIRLVATPEATSITGAENGHQYVIRHPALSSPTSPCPIASPREVPRPGQDQSSSNFSDSSGPLYHMYVKMTEEEDEKMAHRWQKDADGILIFVSPYIASTLEHIDKRKYRRPVYSLLHSPHCSPSLFKTSSQIHKIPLHSTSGTSINFSLTRMYLVHRSLPVPLHLSHLPSLLRNQQSWSTRSGSSVW